MKGENFWLYSYGSEAGSIYAGFSVENLAEKTTAKFDIFSLKRFRF